MAKDQAKDQAAEARSTRYRVLERVERQWRVIAVAIEATDPRDALVKALTGYDGEIDDIEAPVGAEPVFAVVAERYWTELSPRVVVQKRLVWEDTATPTEAPPEVEVESAALATE